MADTVNMSLDDIIKNNKQFRVSRSRGRGGGTVRGRGAGRGRGRGGGGRGGLGHGQTRAGTPGGQQTRSRSRSRGPRGRQQAQSIRGRSQSRGRSRSRSQRRSFSRNRSASRSRSQLRGLTPKGRAGLEEQHNEMPALFRNGRSNRGGIQNRLRRANSNPNLRSDVRSRLGMTTRRGAANNGKPLAIAKRGISKRGRGYNTRNKFVAVGLRSDQILREQRQNLLSHNNIIKSQTFTRSRRNSTNTAASQLTVSVANNFAQKRRNSFGNSGYLNKQSLAQLNNQFGGYRGRRGPGSVKSVGSNKSNRSSHSTQSNTSRARGRGRGGNRGFGRKFNNQQILNPKLQKEIAAIQGKSYGGEPTEAPSGINFAPTPATTQQSLHLRFART